MEVENIIAQHLNIDVSEVTDDKNLILSQCKSSPFQEFQIIQPQDL